MNRWHIRCGTEEELAEIKEALFVTEGDNTGNLTFDKLVPMPDVIIETFAKQNRAAKQEAKRKTGYADWYHWCTEHWGTKWDAMEGKITGAGKNWIILTFDTAYRPPVPVARAFRKRFPNAILSAFYNEPSMDLAGYITEPSPFELFLDEVRKERNRQIRKWGDQGKDSNAKWGLILVEEVGECAKAVLDYVLWDKSASVTSKQAHLFKELVQVAAVAFAWGEAILKSNK